MPDDLSSIILAVIITVSLISWWRKIKTSHESTTKEIQDLRREIENLKNEINNWKGE